MKVIHNFADLDDGNYIYKVGDTYPRDGYKPSTDRVEELQSGKNKIGVPLIEAEESERPKVEPEELKKTTRSSKRKSDKS